MKLNVYIVYTFLTFVQQAISQTPAIKTSNGTIELLANEFVFTTRTKKMYLLTEISELKRQLALLEAEVAKNLTASLTKTNMRLANLTVGVGEEFTQTKSELISVKASIKAATESCKWNISTVASNLTQVSATLSEEIATLKKIFERKDFFTALVVQEEPGPGVCGGFSYVVKVLGVGFVPKVDYKLELTSADKQRTLTPDVRANLNFDNPSVLVFDHKALSTTWMTKYKRYDNVSVRLVTGATSVPFTGVLGSTVFELFADVSGTDPTKKVTLPVSQVVYAENTEASVITNNVQFDNQPASTDGGEIVKVEITPKSSTSTLLVTASLTGTEVANSDNNFQAIITVTKGTAQAQVACGGVEETLGDVSHHMQSMFITCVINNDVFANFVNKGVKTTISLRVGLGAGSFCNNCLKKGYQKGGGRIMSNLLVQERSADEDFTCESISQDDTITHVAQHVYATGATSGTASSNIDMKQHVMTTEANVAPTWGTGQQLHSLKIKPSSKDSMLVIEATGTGVSVCNAGDTQINLCVYSNSASGGKQSLVCTTDEVDVEHCSAYQQLATQMLQRVITAGTTDEITFDLHIGASRGSYYYGSRVNSQNGNIVFGGDSIKTTFSIREILQYTPEPSLFTTSKAFKGVAMIQGFGYFNNYRRLSGSIPWSSTRPAANRGSQLTSVAAGASHDDGVLEVRCQAWMVESYNTADHSTICIFVNNALLGCGVEEDTYGLQYLHGVHARVYWKPGHTNKLTFQCRGGVNGGSADYNGMRGNRMGTSLITMMTVIEH